MNSVRRESQVVRGDVLDVFYASPLTPSCISLFGDPLHGYDRDLGNNFCSYVLLKQNLRSKIFVCKNKKKSYNNK